MPVGHHARHFVTAQLARSYALRSSCRLLGPAKLTGRLPEVTGSLARHAMVAAWRLRLGVTDDIDLDTGALTVRRAAGHWHPSTPESLLLSPT